MKKIMKRLLTGVLTLATVFTALPVTQVHAADSVYTTTDGKAGTIVKIDNGGSEVSSFEESIMNADGQIAYCIDINTNFQTLWFHNKDSFKLFGLDHFQQIFHLWPGIDRLAGDNFAEDVLLRDRRAEVRGGILLDHLLVLAENFLHGHIRAVRTGLAEID